METTEYIWQNGQFVKWDDAKIHVLSHTLHYGGGAFEGIRVYRTEKGPAIFRLDEHIERLFYSSSTINLKLAYSHAEIKAIIIELLQKNKLQQGYIRPLAYYGYGKMGVSPVGAPSELMIACWPWGAYLEEIVDIKTSSYIRVSPKVTAANAKLCGNYLNGILAKLELEGTRYHEALFLDDKGFIAEGPGENFFVMKNRIIYTPTLYTILAGVTRNTVMTIAEKLNYKVIEKDITLAEAYAADEAFFTGTAAEITPIRSIDDHQIATGKMGAITQEIQQYYLDMVYGRNNEFEGYLTYL